MSKQFFHYITYIELFVLLLSAIYGYYRYKSLRGSMKILTIYLSLVFLVEVTSVSLSSQGINNLPLLHFLILAEFILISIFFYRILLKTMFKNKLFLLIVFVSICLLLITLPLFVFSIYEFITITRAIENILIILYCFLYLYNNLAKSTIHSSVQNERPINLAVGSMIIYYSGSLFVFLFASYTVSISKNSSFIVWSVNLFLCISYYLVLFISLWMESRKTKVSAIHETTH